ncbi:F0F1 ATP synthase subunit B [Mycoplasma miroungigenitalium]|nr:F0F1 ATP synthase subunit B [Mycoplasma miroungigenitalium]
MSINNVMLSSGPSITEAFTEKFEKLFPSWPMFVATLVSLVLVLIILWYFLYKPVKKAIKQRQDYIQSNIDQAEQANVSSQELLAKANMKLLNAHDEARNVVKDAKHEGEKVLVTYLEKAKRESKRIINEAKADVKLQKQELLEENQKHIAAAAAMLSRKILKEEVNSDIENKIIDEFLKGE